MKRVAVVAFDGVVPFDLSVPCEVFGRARLADGSAGYEVRVCCEAREADAGAFRIRVRHGLRALTWADTIVVPGVASAGVAISPRLIRALRRAAERGTRVASICSGALVLAETGLLDGRRAATHWLAAPELARRRPTVEVDADVLYVDDGKILTSAGAAAGLDLCLHMVRRDYGAAVAADTARLSVMPLERAGGQAQFIAHVPPAIESGSLEPLQRWLEHNFHRPLGLRDIAQEGAMSIRSLNRRFREQTGTTPLQYLLQLRARRAQHLLETTSASIEEIATRVGFGSAAAFRERFTRVVGASPQTYRRAFRKG